MRHQSITRNGDFSRAYSKGKCFVHPHMVLYVNKNRARKTRVGITTTKKIGNAVVRNRARRVLRVALAANVPPDSGAIDIVVVARAKTATIKSDVATQTLAMLLKKAGVIA